MAPKRRLHFEEQIMRKMLGIATAMALVLAWADHVRSGDDKEARAIVDKAIAASGGEAALAKNNAATFKEKGTYHGMGQPLPYTGKYAVQWPNQFRMQIEEAFVIVVNGDKGWIKTGTDVKDMSKEELAAQQSDLRAEWLISLLPLKDKAFTLTALGEVKINDRPALGVKVTRKDYPDVKLYFDKTTHLLVKSEFKTKMPEQQFKEVDAENLFSDYKDFGGTKVATKLVMKRDGKVYVEAEVTEYQAVGKLDNKMFDRP
jgi:outer membrane lipoprotein-sorting protein